MDLIENIPQDSPIKLVLLAGEEKKTIGLGSPKGLSYEEAVQLSSRILEGFFNNFSTDSWLGKLIYVYLQYPGKGIVYFSGPFRTTEEEVPW
jgi:hypothetical protein